MVSARNSRIVAPKTAPEPPKRKKRQNWRKSWLFVNENNLRFFLLALLISFYMVIGAAIFQLFEEDNEIEIRHSFQTLFSEQLSVVEEIMKKKNSSMSEIENLLYIWGNASQRGALPNTKRKWDYAGSFHFVYTIVATIGYGAAAPRTPGGRIFCIFYGLLGCASGILFFNLFLERIITLLAFIMKANYKRKLRSHEKQQQGGDRRESVESAGDLDSWKPSVYWVMFYLCISSLILGTLASIMYMKIEQWQYLEAFYFCFVTFSTIGFGDFVSAQEQDSFYGPGVRAYQFGNFMVMVAGGCSIYSLFNIISIIIKQTLNWLIERVAWLTENADFFSDRNEVAATPDKEKKTGVMESVIRSEAEKQFTGKVFTTHGYMSNNKSPKTQQNDNGSNDQREEMISSATSYKPQRDTFLPGQVNSLAMASKFEEEDSD